MYEDIRGQIKIGKEEKQHILIIGDFNAKIGEAIEDSSNQKRETATETSKWRKHDNIEHCQRKVQRSMDKSAGEEKSITDYVLTDASSANTVKEMKIDEEKQYGLHKLDKNTATNENRKIYSDHNSILINLDFETPTEEQRPTKIITKKGYK